MKLYLIRHGQTNANLERRHSGWWEAELTELGRTQAQNVGKILEGLSFDKVYTSDLLRAVETQKLALPEIDAEQTSLLREINVGNIGGRYRSDIIAQYGDKYINDYGVYDFRSYGGEDHAAFCERVGKFLKMLEDSPYESVAAFTHGGLICSMLDMCVGAFVDRKIAVCENCSVSMFEYSDSRWRLKLWNYKGEL